MMRAEMTWEWAHADEKQREQLAVWRDAEGEH